MPFPDELKPGGIAVHDYRPDWPAEFSTLDGQLRTLIGRYDPVIEHVGSTSVPGLAAKDVIDVVVLVDDLADERLGAALEDGGFRRRPEPWNRVEVTYGEEYAKLVFAPPVGARPCNVHVRERTPSARYTLLFRDFLRADANARAGWGAFKQRLAETVTDLFDYGQIKAPATDVLMSAAERWAEQTGWNPWRATGG